MFCLHVSFGCLFLRDSLSFFCQQICPKRNGIRIIVGCQINIWIISVRFPNTSKFKGRRWVIIIHIFARKKKKKKNQKWKKKFHFFFFCFNPLSFSLLLLRFWSKQRFAFLDSVNCRWTRRHKSSVVRRKKTTFATSPSTLDSTCCSDSVKKNF